MAGQPVVGLGLYIWNWTAGVARPASATPRGANPRRKRCAVCFTSCRPRRVAMNFRPRRVSCRWGGSGTCILTLAYDAQVYASREVRNPLRVLHNPRAEPPNLLGAKLRGRCGTLSGFCIRERTGYPLGMSSSALVLAPGAFATDRAKTAHGLVRGSDGSRWSGGRSASAGRDAGELLDGERREIPVFASLAESLQQARQKPEACIVGVAMGGGFMPPEVKACRSRRPRRGSRW